MQKKPKQTILFNAKSQLSYLSTLSFFALLLNTNAAFAAQATQAFNVTATIAQGCMLGSSGTTDVSSFGTINFGSNISSLFTPINVASSQNSGSVVIKCTPNIPVTVALNAGSNATGNIGTTGRLMKLSTGTATLPYQLYQNTNRTTIWGNGSNGGQLLSFTSDGTVQVFNVYATLFSTPTLPAVGQYNDLVTVTVTY